MNCHCSKCGYPCECGEEYCEACFLESLHEDSEKNIYAGGKFYPSCQPQDKQEIKDGLD